MGQIRLMTVSAEAGQDLSSFQYRAMAYAADGQIDNVTTAGASIDGILQDKPSAAGKAAMLGIVGVTLAEAGGTFSAGADLTPDSVGRLVAAGTGDVICAVARQAATASGQHVEVQLKIQAEAPT